MSLGAWLGTIMLFNVWVLIWPNQKKVLGMVEATAEEIAKQIYCCYGYQEQRSFISSNASLYGWCRPWWLFILID